MKRTLCILLAAALALALLPGCGGAAKAKDKVRLCEVTHSVFYAPQYAAIQLGFFDDQNIEIELSNGQGADKVMAAVLSDNVEIGFAGPEASIYVFNEGKKDHTQVFAQLTQRDGSFLMAREPDPDFTWEKLRGSHVLSGRKGGVPYMALEYVIRHNGMDPRSDLVMDDSVQFSLMTGAFTGGNGDYATCFEPTASMVEAEGKGYIVASVGEAAGEIPYTAYFAKKSYLEKNKDLVQRFTNAVYQGQQWVAEHTAAEVAQAIAPAFPDTGEEILTQVVQRYKDIGAWNTDPVMTEEAFERLQTVMEEAGELAQRADYTLVVNNTFARASTR
ncbi:MAG: ABC transporter substrate-binding protein [Angelakisella sp.]|jgi:NitT/TauT family transport system substrate-binding protein|nr:ABC transporter substrate-binding protein [Angelakisella sp.]